VMEKKGFDKLKLDLPLNLPTNVDDSENNVAMENRFLVDRPSNSSIGDSRLASAFVSSTTLDKYSTLVHPISDPYEQLAIKNDKLWPNDFIALPYLPFFSSCDGYDRFVWRYDLTICGIAFPSLNPHSTCSYSFTVISV